MARKTSEISPNPRVVEGDNSAAVEEANRVQFLSIFARLDEAEAKIEEAAAVVKAAQAGLKVARNGRKSVVGMAKMAGVPEWQLQQRQDELKRSTLENAQTITAEGKQRRWLGIISPEQMKMHLDGTTPEEVRDAEDAKSEGFKCGVRGRAAVIPETMHPRFHQDFMRGHEAGWKDYLLAMAENAPKGPNVTAEEVAEQARKDWQADHEPGTPEYAAAERAAIRKAKESLTNMQPTEEQISAVQEASRKLAEENPAFEASEDELAQQAGRPSNGDETIV